MRSVGELLQSRFAECACEKHLSFQNPRVASLPIAGSPHVHGAEHSRYSRTAHQQQRVHFTIGTSSALRSQNGKWPNRCRGGCHVRNVVPKSSTRSSGRRVFFPAAFAKSRCFSRNPAPRLPAPLAGVANATPEHESHQRCGSGRRSGQAIVKTNRGPPLLVLTGFVELVLPVPR